MDVREKLVEIVKKAAYSSLPSNTEDFHLNMFVTNLLAHGVTVQEWKLGVKKTNADRIRSMSDEELAKFIDDIAQSVADGEYCTAFLNVKNFPYSCEDTKKACVAHVVDWLQQPAEEADNG